MAAAEPAAPPPRVPNQPPTAPSGATGPGGPPLVAASAPLKVTVVADPPEAELFVDRKSVGQGPFVIPNLDPTHLYHLRAVAPGHRVAEKTARFAQDETVNLVLRESRRHSRAVSGSPILSSKPVAKVFVDGHPTDRYTPIPPSAPLELPSGDHLQSTSNPMQRKRRTSRSPGPPHGVKKLLGVPADGH